MHTPFSLRRAILAIVATVFVLVGCGDDAVDPDESGLVDRTATSAVDSVLANFFEGNEGVDALDALGGIIASVTGVSGSAPVAVDDAGRAVITGSLADRLISSGASANIPTALLGVTCIWDLEQQRYVADPDDPGNAPPNGIRFRLYRTDAVTRLPVAPLDDIGFVDIIDTSSGDNVDVSVLVDVGGVSVLDYGVAGTFTLTSFNVTTAGTSSDGESDLDFSLTVSGDANSFTASFGIAAGSASLQVSIMLDATGAGQAIATLVSGNDAITFATSFDENGIIEEGSVVTLNEDVIANVTGNVLSPVVTPTADSPITSRDSEELAALFVDGVSLFDALSELASLGLAFGGRTPPGSEAPTVTDIDFPSTIGGAPGDTTVGTVSFFDPDGDIVLASFDVVSSDLGFTPFSFDPDVLGTVQGEFGFIIFCNPGGPACDGSATLQVTLEDSEGNVSLPFRFSFTMVPPTGAAAPDGTPAGAGIGKR